MLQINHLEKSYQDRIILNHISLTIAKPGLYGVVGGNGAGKTTFFKCLSGLEPYQGEILYNKKTLSSDGDGDSAKYWSSYCVCCGMHVLRDRKSVV